MKKFTIMTLVMLALLSACSNPFVNSILPDKNENGGNNAISIAMSGNETGDNVTPLPASGKAGDEITLNYTVADTKTNNWLVFSGTKTAIAQVDRAETGTRKYTVNKEDAVNGVITINAVFTHSNSNPPPVSYTIVVNMSGNETGDNVAPLPASGKAGDEITLNYTVAHTKVHNRLVFSGTKTAVAQVDNAGTGTRKYTVSAEDATEGVITIHAVFAHSNKEFDDIAFADGNNETKVYGSPDFTKAITNSGKGTGAISYDSSNQAVATVNNSGTVTILKTGTTDITATKAEDDDYSAAEAVYTLTVTHLQLTKADPAIITTKDYDGGASAEITEVGELTNKVGDDDVTVSAAANFASKDAGAKQITVVYTIGGADAGNYIKPVDYKINGTINKKQLTIADPAITTTKPYDGAVTAEITEVGALTNKIEGDTVTVSADGTYASANVGTNITITVVYTIGGADAANYTKPVNYTTTTGIITKVQGSAVSVPKTASKTDDSITVRAVNMLSPNLGQTAEYAIGTTSSGPSSGWQDGRTFGGLTKDSIQYVFARSKEDANCDAGVAQVSVAIKVIDDSYRKTVIDFEGDTVGKTYSFTQGDNSPTVKVASDPANGGQKSLQITTGGNGWNQAAIIPVYLPYELSNYDSFSFRFRLLSIGGDTTPRAIQVYAASDTATFKRYSFGNPSSNGNNFAANLVGGTAETLFGDSYKNTWTEYEITCSPGSAISNLQGNIYIAIGMNCNDVRGYMLDDLTFLMKDTFDPPPYITPVTATFDKNAQSDITVTMALQGKTLTGITSSGTTFNSSNYTVSGNTVTLKKEYLELQSDGATTLTFTFSDGTTKTFVINIGVFLKYDFANGSKIDDDYPKYSSSNITAVITGGVLLVTKSNSNHSTEKFILPFNVGTGNLSLYSDIKIRIKVLSGDGGYKDLRAWVGAGYSNELGSKQANFTEGGDYQDVLVPISLASANTYTGKVEIAFGLNNTQAVTYDITSIELVPK